MRGRGVRTRSWVGLAGLLAVAALAWLAHRHGRPPHELRLALSSRPTAPAAESAWASERPARDGASGLTNAGARSPGGTSPATARPIDAELARLVRQLQARDSAYRRIVCRWISRVVPAISDALPRWFDPRAGTADRRRLEAHDALLAQGEAVRPALPLLAEAFANEEAAVRTYALDVIIQLQPGAGGFMAAVPRDPVPFARAVRHLCGVLRDEDERVRDFAWRCLAASRAAAPDARPAVVAVRDDPAAEAALRVQAEQTLRAWE